MTNINRLIHNNRIENVKELISKNLYDEALLDDDYFFFNVKFDENNQPIVNTGKDDDHLHIHMTSKRLFSNIDKNGVHHIDGTYKITRNGFPLILYGVTDIQGHFHPICFVVSSHENETDYEHFYDGLIRLADQLNLEFSPDYIMQDAWRASYNAVKKFFPDCKVLMCYFHVVDNIRKHKKLIPIDKYEELKDDITEIHMSSNEKEFNQ